MPNKPTYEELEKRIAELENVAFEHELLEKKLWESEERYRRIVRATTDYIYTVHVQDGHATDTVHGPTCEAVTGYTVKDFRANPYLWIHMVPEEDRKVVEEHAAKTVSGQKVSPLEHRIIRKDGVIRWVRNTLVQNWDGNGRLVSYDGLLQDITDRKLAEEALRQSEAKYRAIFDNTGTATIIGAEDTTILMVNSEFEDLSGYSKKEIEGRISWTQFVVKDDLESILKYHRLRRIDQNATPRNHEFRFIDRHGNVKNVFATVATIPGTTNGVASFSDITAEKRVQEELRKINDELSNFVQVVSHDLKHPIISIQGFSSRLFRKHQGSLGEKEKEYLRQIKVNARRMGLLVSDLLTLANSGQVVSDFEDASSLEIVKKAIAVLQYRLKEGTDLVVQKNLPTIRCNKERIYQVFENLLVNSVKFSADVQHPRIEIGYNDRVDFHEFQIKDNGIGIDPKYHGKIFEKFSRLKEIEDEEGTGLGLAIVKRIVDNHGGTVWVESEKGKGATFYFTIPKTPYSVAKQDEREKDQRETYR